MSEITKYCFIVNPVAGSGLCAQKFEALSAELDRRGVAYSVLYTEAPGHAGTLARDALKAGASCIVAVGGDGTFREVAKELVHTGVPMGYLPLGTGNDIAKSLGIPDADAALDILLSGGICPMDAAQVDEKLYFNICGLGFDVDVLVQTERYRGRRTAKLAYYLGLLNALVFLRSVRLTATCEERTYTGAAVMLNAGNGRFFGGGMKATPEAVLTDGLLDILIVKKIGRLRVLRCLAGFFKGKHIRLSFVEYFRTREITVRSDPPARIQLDGEIIARTPATIRVLPGALRIMARAGSEALPVSASKPEQVTIPV